MKALLIIGAVLLSLLVIFFLILLVVYLTFFYTPLKNQNDEHHIQGVGKYLDEEKLHTFINKMQAVPYEDLYIESFDHLKLHAFFYENKNSNDYILLFNGYRGRPRRDYCSRTMDLINAGKNVILCEQRGHGLSEGHTITLGRKEQYDVVSWVKFAQEKFGKNAKIAVAGTSFGATTVLLSSDKLPENVKVFADSPYGSEKSIIQHVAKLKKINPRISWSLVYLAALIFGHVRLNDDTAENVSKSKSKILIVHCTGDTLVPMEMNKKLFSLKKDNIKMVFFENLQHAMPYFKEHDKYMKMFHEFLNE